MTKAASCPLSKKMNMTSIKLHFSLLKPALSWGMQHHKVWGSDRCDLSFSSYNGVIHGKYLKL